MKRLSAAIAVVATILFAAVGSWAPDSQPVSAGPPTTRVGVHVVIQVTTTPPAPEDCPEAANTPGGDDGQGGCFPGAFNTGPSGTLGDYTGTCTITADDTLIDSMVIDNCQSGMTIDALNVTIRNSHLVFNSTPGTGIDLPSNDTVSLSVEDSWIDSAQCTDCGVHGWNFALIRTEVTGGSRGAYCVHNCLVQDSWIHGTNLNPTGGAHASGMRVEQYATVDHSTLACDWFPPDDPSDTGCSADITGYPDFVPIHHNTVTDNLLVGNPGGLGFCIYGGWNPGKPFNDDVTNATYIVWQRNVFQRGGVGEQCGDFGATTAFNSSRTGNVCTANVYDDGSPVTCDE
jgi:hypothetical protein